MRCVLRGALLVAAVAVGAMAFGQSAPLSFDGQTRQLSANELWVLEDPGADLNIHQVTGAPFSGRFHSATDIQGELRQTPVWWVRLQIHSLSSEARRIAINPVGFWSDVRLYAASPGGWSEAGHTGWLVPLSQRSLQVTRDEMVFLPVAATLASAAVTTLYLRLAGDEHLGGMRRLRVELYDLQRLSAEERQLRWGTGLYLGALIALAVYHLLLMLALRDASYGWYVMHIAGVGLLTAMGDGLTFEYLWPEHPDLAQVELAIYRLMLIGGLAQFARGFLDLRRDLPRADMLLKTVLAFLCVLTLLPFAIDSSPITMARDVTFLALFVLGFGAGWVSLRRGNPLARYFLLGNMFTVGGVAVMISAEFGLLPAWAGNAAPAGALIEALLLSQGLGYKISRLRQALADKNLAEERARREQEQERRQFVETQKAELEQRVSERTAELSAERERSEALLRNILPAPIAEELKRSGRSEPRRHEEVSILFTDFESFTQTVSTIPPQRMIAELNEVFRGFDDIVDRHGLEKIKTIGDAYMAAAGVPEAVPDHAARCAAAALEMQQWIAARNQTASIKWGLRIGVHSGPVVAGVVGSRKYAYDIWGDTVNIASRMESSGAPGRVNVSAYTYDLIRDRFDCEYRGKVAAKGKGEIDMYFVVARKAAAAEQ